MQTLEKRQRQAIFTTDLPPEKWPDILVDILPEEEREEFYNKKKAVTLYYEGRTLRDIEALTGISRGSVRHYAKRSMILNQDGQIWGFRVLVPNSRAEAYKRTQASSPKLPEAQGGHSGLLQQTLNRFPEINVRLIKLILKRGGKKVAHDNRIRIKDLHREFIKLLKEKNVADTEWPFNTKHKGIRSLGHFMNSVLEQNFCSAVYAREESAASAHTPLGTGTGPVLVFTQPYEAVEIDAYYIDAHFTVGFVNPNGNITEVLLSRLWLISIIDRVSTAVLAYEIVYRSEVSASDVVGLIAKAVNQQWQRLPLSIPKLEYLPDSGLPSGVFPELRGAVWGTLMLDNALAHLSTAISEQARRLLGFSVNWGPVRHFERRPNIERLHLDVANQLFWRLPSTTGSNPHNRRAANGEYLAEKLKIRVDEVEQQLDVYMASHNVRPNEGIFFISPLEYLRQSLERGIFMPRHIPNHNADKATFPMRVAVTVRGSMKSGRRPYCQFLREHYSSPIMAASYNLVGKNITLEIDVEDLRQVKAYLSDGSSLGFLTAQGKWRQSKHDLKTRRAILSLMSSGDMFVTTSDNPVQIYLNYLSQGTRKNALKTDLVPAPKAATEAVRVAKAADIDLQLEPNSKNQSPAPAFPLLSETSSIMPGTMPSLSEILGKKGR
jgi:putative transposase